MARTFCIVQRYYTLLILNPGHSCFEMGGRLDRVLELLVENIRGGSYESFEVRGVETDEYYTKFFRDERLLWWNL